MYSPVDLPSSTRAAPAKKRMLSAEIPGSSTATAQGLPVLSDSRRASSSAFSSIASAIFSSTVMRSPGVESSHSGSALAAASTARSTSAWVPCGTSAIFSPVAGLITSIVAPSTASTQSPPTKFLYAVAVSVAMQNPSSEKVWMPNLHAARSGRAASQHSRIAHQTLRQYNRNDRQSQHHQAADVDVRQLL